jgi:hypothetical protein
VGTHADERIALGVGEEIVRALGSDGTDQDRTVLEGDARGEKAVATLGPG